MPCGSIGTPELLIIFLLLLLLFGAKKLPALAKSIGVGITEFKKGLSGITSEIDKDLEDEIENSKGEEKTKKNSKSKKKTVKKK